MEELKVLIEAIAGLPDLAIWVIAMYFFFKIAIVGSIFGVARLVVNKVYESIKLKYAPKEVIEKEKIVEKEVLQISNLNFGQYVISGVEKRLSDEIERIIGATRRDDSFKYIHNDDVNELIKFTDAYIESKKQTKGK